jgi:hypothetical protein
MGTREAVSKAAEDIALGISTIIEEAISKALEEYSNHQPNNEKLLLKEFKEDDDFTDINGAMKITNYKRNTIYDYVAKDKIPYKKVSRKLIFSKSKLISWIKETRLETK